MRQHYKAIKINGRKKDAHRHIMEGIVGRKLTFNEVVHHKDGNRLNNNPSNLELMSRSEHSRMHMKGRFFSDATLDKIRAAAIQRRSLAKLSTNQVLEIKEHIRNGRRSTDIAISYNVTRETIRRIKSGKSWYWL